MGCGCRKTFCQNKVCKCKKANSYCTDDCACGIACRNKENPQQNGHAASSSSPSPVEHDSWEDVRGLIQEEEKLVQAMKELNVVPPAVQDIMKKKKADIQQMRELLQLLRQMGPALLKKEVLSPDEWESFYGKLKPCNVCHRKFNPDRIKTHQEICIRRSAAQ